MPTAFFSKSIFYLCSCLCCWLWGRLPYCAVLEANVWRAVCERLHACSHGCQWSQSLQWGVLSMHNGCLCMDWMPERLKCDKITTFYIDISHISPLCRGQLISTLFMHTCSSGVLICFFPCIPFWPFMFSSLVLHALIFCLSVMFSFLFFSPRFLFSPPSVSHIRFVTAIVSQHIIVYIIMVLYRFVEYTIDYALKMKTKNNDPDTHESFLALVCIILSSNKHWIWASLF